MTTNYTYRVEVVERDTAHVAGRVAHATCDSLASALIFYHATRQARHVSRVVLRRASTHRLANGKSYGYVVEQYEHESETFLPI